MYSVEQLVVLGDLLSLVWLYSQDDCCFIDALLYTGRCGSWLLHS